MNRTALIVGATGLVGGHCLTLLLDDPDTDSVVALTRKPLPESSPKLQQHAVDFDHPGRYAPLVKANDIYCCLGTTIKKAGSRPAFEKVDFQYVCDIARLAAEGGAQQFLLVSSLGANPRSTVFYNRVKGKVEEAVSRVGFKSLHVFRPSILLGERPEFRPAERIGTALMVALSFAMVGRARKYKPVRAEEVARAMVAAAKSPANGITIYESDAIRDMGRSI